MTPVEELLASRYGELGQTPDSLVDIALFVSGDLEPSRHRLARRAATKGALAPTVAEAGVHLPASSRRSWWIGGALALAAALAIVIVPDSDHRLAPHEMHPQMTPKGSHDVLRVAVQRGARSFVLQPGDTLRPGDRVGFFYDTERTGHLAIFYRDDEGVTALYPRDGSTAAPIERAAEGRLDAGATLHEGEGCAWFIGVFTDAPTDLEDLERQVGQANRGLECELRLELGRTAVVVPARWEAP